MMEMMMKEFFNEKRKIRSGKRKKTRIQPD